jgi:hypothetical protein
MSDIEYKRFIDQFLIENYKFLNECAKNILKGKKTDYNDLVAELTIYLYSNKTKLIDYIDIKMLQAFSVSWLKIQGRYKTSPFNIKYQSYSNESEMPEVSSSPDEVVEDPYIKDLRNHFNDESVQKILYIHNQYGNLTKVQQILFDAHFIDGLSYDKIRSKYDFFREKNGKKVFYKSKKSIYNMMNELKNDIRNGYNGNSGN